MLTDVIFIQEGSQKLRETLAQNQKYHIEVSPDLDTMICLKKDRFKTITSLQALGIFDKGEYELLDWNNHSTIAVADKIIMISGHLSSNKKINAENIQTLKKGLKMLREKHPDYEFICGADLNSYLKDLDDHIHIYPKE